MSNVPYFNHKEIGPRTWQIGYNYTDKGFLFCYLIEGDDYALVIDTMNGYGNLRAYVETLTDKPIKLFNTHYHFDHTGGNFDFDSCYMHPADIALFYDSKGRTQDQMLERARAEALPEYKDAMEACDFCQVREMKVYPVNDGDIFDLGGRRLEAVEVGGHTPGCMVLIDDALRIAYTGDACNDNTLMSSPAALSVEKYLKNLLRFKHYASRFDIMYGGHIVLDPVIIDEGIELCGRVLAGIDDHEERPGFMGRVNIYGARHSTTTIFREDGKTFNISYNPEHLWDEGPKHQVIHL